MAIIATVNILGTVAGDPAGSRSDTATWTSGTSLRAVTYFAATAAFAQVTIPSGATACMIMPPAGNANLITVAGANTDTGIACGTTGPIFLPVSAGALWVKTAANTLLEISWY